MREGSSGRIFRGCISRTFSIKNPGFIEEREWRFIYQDTASSTLASDIVSVDGIPQVIYKLPLSSPLGLASMTMGLSGWSKRNS